MRHGPMLQPWNLPIGLLLERQRLHGGQVLRSRGQSLRHVRVQGRRRVRLRQLLRRWRVPLQLLHRQRRLHGWQLLRRPPAMHSLPVFVDHGVPTQHRVLRGWMMNRYGIFAQAVACAITISAALLQPACSSGASAPGGSTSSGGSGGGGTGASAGSAGSGGSIGGACSKNADCPSGLCLEIGVCTRRCVNAGDCPPGPEWSCSPLPGVGNLCQCTASSTSDSCDGKDNDCNGLVDDGTTCPANQVCQGGACGCAAPLSLCAQSCADTESDSNNCGACGKSCTAPPHASPVCKAGSCAIGGCDMQYGDCDGEVANGCETDLLSDASNCGKCAHGCQYPPCASGTCTGVCSPGATQCDGLVLKTCNGNAQWDGLTPCSFVCENDACVGECKPGAKRCDTKAVQVCNVHGQWEDKPGGDCQYVCKNGACAGQCTPGATRCLGKWAQSCDSDGNWVSDVLCPFACDGAACVGECVPGATQCDATTVQTCDALGQWQVGLTCPFVCQNGACIGMCMPGTHKCTGTALQSCDANGKWDSGAPCSYVCQNGSCSGQCVPGSKQCSGLDLQSCSVTGQWTAEQTCPYVCQGGACSGQCIPGSKKCSGLVPQMCGALGQWQNGTTCLYVCSNGNCGVCAPGTKQCSGEKAQTCQSNGQWDAGTSCSGGTPECSGGQCYPTGAAGPSCSGLAESCGPGGNANCCVSRVVQGGTFDRGNDANYPATVSDFRLDNYEITVGRFRKFVAAYSQSMVASGAGKNTNNPADSGWDKVWDGNLPADAVVLTGMSGVKCDSTYQTWTDTAGGNENRPINCINWYIAYAFCIWDGGRLPTEAEWNYAAAGGDEQRQYPWGAAAPDDSYAAYYPGSWASTQNVASKSPKGDGRWWQADLAGNVWEWVQDWDASPYCMPCTNCANLASASNRVIRGGSFRDNSTTLLSSSRGHYLPAVRSHLVGARCTRSAP